MDSKRLSRAEWGQLDDLLGKHGFGGYYDLVESLKSVAGDLGISLIGVDLYPETSGGQSMSLPQAVQYLQDWARFLSRTDGFNDVAKSAASETYIEKGVK